PPPAAPHPVVDPPGHRVDEVATVAREDHPGRPLEGREWENRAPDGHPVVRRVRLTQPEVAPDPAIPRMPVLDQPGRATRAGPVLILISEARFIGVDVNRRTRYSCHRCDFGMIRGHGATRRNRYRRP